MSQDYTDDCFNGSHVAQTDMANIEKNFATLKSSFSGPTTPANMVAGMFWFDTTADILKIRNEANTGWVEIWDFGNQTIPGSAIPADYVTAAMLNSAAGSEAVTSDVIRDAAIKTDKIQDGAVTKAKIVSGISWDTADIADGAIKRDKLATAAGTVSTNSTASDGARLTLPGGYYGFHPQLYSSGSSGYTSIALRDSTTLILVSGTAAAAAIRLKTNSGSYTAYCRQRYVTASPPYKIGDALWGHFLFLLRNISDKKIIAAYEAPDPPWAHNGPEWHKKDSKERIQAVPHPFADYIEKDPTSDGLEIVLSDLRNVDVNKIKTDAHKIGKDYVSEFNNLNPAGKTLTTAEVAIPGISGFTDRVKIQRI